MVELELVGLEWTGLEWVIAGTILGWTKVVEDNCVLPEARIL